MYVVIDDRIPVKAKDGRVVFASCCDPNELWVPLIEKVGPVCCCLDDDDRVNCGLK
jgi:hypothetical protein